MSPTLKTWKIDGPRFVLTFNHTESLYLYDPDFGSANGFELCGADGVWKPAKIANLKYVKRGGRERTYGNIDGNRLVIEADGVPAPKKLRYLHSAPWFGSVYSDACLPLGAFHIGD